MLVRRSFDVAMAIRARRSRRKEERSVKAAARTVLDDAGHDVDPEKVNALEAPDGLDPEIIPATWTPEHVLKQQP